MVEEHEKKVDGTAACIDFVQLQDCQARAENPLILWRPPSFEGQIVALVDVVPGESGAYEVRVCLYLMRSLAMLCACKVSILLAN